MTLIIILRLSTYKLNHEKKKLKTKQNYIKKMFQKSALKKKKKPSKLEYIF